MSGLPVVGLSRFSSVDWVGVLCATVFLQGCPLRCSYCHNPGLIPSVRSAAGSRSVAASEVSWEDVVEFLGSRRGLLEGVVFSGGEPLTHDIAAGVTLVRELGYRVGVHTSGVFPSRLGALLDAGVLDWVGLDAKGPSSVLPGLTGSPVLFDRWLQSLDRVLGSGVWCEVRTTWRPGLYPASGVVELAGVLLDRGVEELVIQRFRERGELLWSEEESDVLGGLVDELTRLGTQVTVR